MVDLDCLAAEEEEEVEEGSTMSILRLRVVMVEGFVWFGGREVGRGFGGKRSMVASCPSSKFETLTPVSLPFPSPQATAYPSEPIYQTVKTFANTVDLLI